MFSLTSEPIQALPLGHEGAGGFVVFEGKVRNHADGREVLRLEYEAFPEMAISEGEALLREARERFGLLAASVVHRTGMLEIGETAVLIQVAAAHRRAAFEDCEWIIDQLKFRVPIWKRETYADGPAEWVGVQDGPAKNEDAAYYDRQMRLEEVGPEGQARLAEARVLLVGLGGLGSSALPYLVGAGVGTLGLIDPDEVAIHNLHRQVIYGAGEVGRSKVERAAAAAKRLRPSVAVDAFPEKLTSANVDRFVSAYDWIVDGTDSLEVKFLLNAVCRRHRKPLVTASIHRFEGHLMTVAPDGPCLNCLFPVPPPTACVSSCAETGVLGVVPGLMGILQANEVLKGILGFGEVLSSHLLLVDLRSGETVRLGRETRPGCPGCQGLLSPDDDIEVDDWQAENLRVIDIREPDETPALAIRHERIPLSAITDAELPGRVLLVCASGVRSYRLATQLRKAGHSDVFSLRGGILGNPRLTG